MTKFNVSISETAARELDSLDSNLIERIRSSIKELDIDPFRSRPKADIKKLKGPKNPFLYRLRIGNYRIIYTVEGKEVKITHILKRSAVYKLLD